MPFSTMTQLRRALVIVLPLWSVTGCAVGLPNVTEWPESLLSPTSTTAKAAATTTTENTGAEVAAGSATADEERPAWLSDAQWQEVVAGDLVTKPMKFSIRSGDYIGGVAVMRVHAPPGVVGDYITNVNTMPDWLPITQRAELIGKPGCDVVIELEQGFDAYSKTYSIHGFRVGNMVQWRLDPSRPHDIDDLWGYFRMVPYRGHTLLVMGIAADLRLGPLGLIVEDRGLERLLQLPNDIRMEVEGRVQGIKRQAAAGDLTCVLPP